ncbi:MAG: hypothetical protein ACKOQ7_03335, partial [Actinomycetota bacterium]
MSIDTPAPEELEAVLVQKADREVESVGQTTRSEQVRAENLVASQHWGGIQWRIIATFLFFSVCWGGVLYLGVTSAI